MIARLLEANYFANRNNPTKEQITFWLRELRTASLLIEVAAQFPDECKQETSGRELLLHAVAANEPALEEALKAEEEKQREADRRYWQPLKAELQRLRKERNTG